MSILFMVLLAVLFLALGVYIGARLKRRQYQGVIRITESPTGLKFSLEVLGDPEHLIFHEDATFKILAPDYEKLISQDKPGV